VKTSWCVVLVLSFCYLLCIPASSAAPPSQEVVKITDAAHDDARLNAPVTIAEKSISLRSLFDEVSRQTGMEIGIDARDPSSSYRVFVQCDRLPAYQVLDALWSAFSLKHHEWMWLRRNKLEGDHKSSSYTFLEPQSARDPSAVYDGIVTGLLEKFVQFMQDTTRLKPVERVKHRDELARLLMFDDPTLLSSFFEGAQSEWFWSQTDFFTSALNRDQQVQVLSGGTADVNLKSIPDSVYAFYHQHFLLTNGTFTDPAGKITQLPEPTSVTFYRQSPMLQEGILAPMVMLKESGKSGGGSWMGTGALQVSVGNAVKHAWMLPGDSSGGLSDSRLVEPVERPSGAAAEPNPDGVASGSPGFRLSPAQVLHGPEREATQPLELKLRQLSLGASIPVVAVLPLSYPYRFSDPVGKPVKEFLGTMEGNTKHHMYKWRDGTLIVSYPLRFLTPSHTIPAATLQALNPDKYGFAAVADWASMGANIDDSQIKWLLDVVGSRADATQIRKILLLIKRHPELLHDQGVFLDAETVTEMYKQGLVSDTKTTAGAHTRVRVMVDAPAPTNSLAGMNVAIQWRNEDTHYWMRGAFATLPNLQTLRSSSNEKPDKR